MRVKREYTSNSKENYERFILKYKIDKYKLPFEKYKKIIEINNWMFIEYVLETGNKIRLPHGFGDISINKKILKKFKEYNGKRYINLRIDWKKTNQEGKRIYHTNEHSDGFNYKWIWFPASAYLFMSKLYVFKACRYASRAIAKYVKKPNSIYKELYNEYPTNTLKKIR